MRTHDIDWLSSPADDQTAWQALDYLNLYRCFVALLFSGLFFTPVMQDVLAAGALLSARVLTALYILVAGGLLAFGRYRRKSVRLQAVCGISFDLLGTFAMVYVIGGLSSGVGVLLVGTTGAAGALLPVRVSLSIAAAATLVLLWQTTVNVIQGVESFAAIAPAGMLGAAYFATTLLGHYLALRARESQRLAHQQSADLAQLSEFNELIVARMRTGILIVGHDNLAHAMNDAAWYLMGMPSHRTGQLEVLAPELLGELEHWRKTGRHGNQPLGLAAGVPAIVPRFARLSVNEYAETLVFLEDSSMVSRRAQELTLASLGRLSASIAHEIRNPLAAISHSAQLLAEAESLTPPDKRLSQIITRHCARMNDIIENVLQLARQEPPRPEAVHLSDWLHHFVEDFSRHYELREHAIEVRVDDPDVAGLIDPGHLQQVMWNLCQNAFKYGHRGEQGAHVTLSAGYLNGDGAPVIDVTDQGEGVAEKDRERIFQPFFTSSPDGTGLGLYICQQLCASNQADLSYIASEGGSTFRIAMAAPPSRVGGEFDAPLLGPGTLEPR